jgi:hypothetical protein
LSIGDSFLGLQAMDAIGTPLISRGILLQESQLTSKNCVQMLELNNIKIHTVSGLTKGQAASALIALESEANGNCIIGTCDSLVFPKESEILPARGKTLGVWVTKPSEFAIRHPEQFGWVNLDANGVVSGSWVKKEPSTQNERFVITGTFYFGDKLDSIDLLKEFLAQGNTVNNEYYLDSLLEFAKQKNWQVYGLLPEWFISLGTPDEYETYIYWEELFNARPDLLVTDEA